MQSLQTTTYSTAARVVAHGVATKLKDITGTGQRPLLSRITIPQEESPREEIRSSPSLTDISQNFGE